MDRLRASAAFSGARRTSGPSAARGVVIAPAPGGALPSSLDHQRVGDIVTDACELRHKVPTRGQVVTDLAEARVKLHRGSETFGWLSQAALACTVTSRSTHQMNRTLDVHRHILGSMSGPRRPIVDDLHERDFIASSTDGAASPVHPAGEDAA